MLMLLQSLILTLKEEADRKIILIIISQVNLLICLVNDILECKLIEQNKFRKHNT